MAFSSRVANQEARKMNAVQDSALPGHTIDAFLDAGDIVGAREELERLCLEGMDSGTPISMTPESWEAFRLDLHRKAKIAS